jgi:CHAD domain-containing protein
MLAYFDERREVFQSALKAARSYFAVEGIHDLRLEIKRFRVLYKLIDYAAPSFASKPNLTAFNELFRAAGALRDVDIYQAITLPWLRANDLSEYFNYLKKNELRLRIVFSDTVSRYSTTSISNSRRRIISALAVVGAENQRKRISKKILKFVPKLNSLIDRNKPSNSDLHALRKSAKSLKYSLDIWQVCFGKSALSKDVSNQLQKTYRNLGDWHDFLLSHDSVDAFLAGEVQGSLTDSTAYAKFKKDLRQRADNCLATYERSKKSLHKSLKRLKPDFG